MLLFTELFIIKIPQVIIAFKFLEIFKNQTNTGCLGSNDIEPKGSIFSC